MKASFSSSLRNALAGLRIAFQTERNLKIHLFIAAFVVVLAFSLSLAAYEWLWVIACIALVLMVELINTAIEAVVDLASPEIHPLAKKAKDISAGAVLLAAAFSVIAGIIIFLPKFLPFLC